MLVPPGIPLPFFLLFPPKFLFTSFLFFIVHMPMAPVVVLLTKCYCTLLLISSKVHEVEDVRRQLLKKVRYSKLALQNVLAFRWSSKKWSKHWRSHIFSLIKKREAFWHKLTLNKWTRNENIFYSKIPCQVAYGQPYLIKCRTIASSKVVAAGHPPFRWRVVSI